MGRLGFVLSFNHHTHCIVQRLLLVVSLACSDGQYERGMCQSACMEALHWPCHSVMRTSAVLWSQVEAQVHSRGQGRPFKRHWVFVGG